MYATCTFCHAPLGRNEALDHFPVGRRLAFDQARGRLWVVCGACLQWNLSPLETRWEAIEEAERAYRDTRLRAATDQIGLARLRDGTDLIRIGQPLRPEFAAWRYGGRFAQRWQVKGRVMAAGAGLIAMTKGMGGYMMLQVASGPLTVLLGLRLAASVVKRRVVASQFTPRDGRVRLVTHYHLDRMRVRKDRDVPEGWLLELPTLDPDQRFRWARASDDRLLLAGPAAERALAQLLPRLNSGGGPKRAVADAVSLLDRFRTPDAVMRYAGRLEEDYPTVDTTDAWLQKKPRETGLGAAPAAVRLAAEMAVHEESERRALEGELAALEAQWRDAEEVAAIADSLTTSPTVLRTLERLRLR